MIGELKSKPIAVGSIAIVTPTHNRMALLERLCESLGKQDDLDFSWIVVDDDSSDGTVAWLAQISQQYSFPIIVLSTKSNIGKSAALNQVFSSVCSEIYCIVDSDDRLLPDAVSKIREKLSQASHDPSIGALFFSYQDTCGVSLGGPDNGEEVVMTRAEMDATHGRYDGCVAYLSAGIRGIRYPEFAGETYLGPTVLQLLMSPPYRMLFTPTVVGVAEYQPEGLTHGGRALRLKNPRGMMFYSKLNAECGESWLWRLKYRISYWAYATRLSTPLTAEDQRILCPPKSSPIVKMVGFALGAYWHRRAG